MGQTPISRVMPPPRRRTRLEEDDELIEQAKRVYVAGHCTLEELEAYVELLLRRPTDPRLGSEVARAARA